MDMEVLDHYLRFIFYSSHVPVYLYRGDQAVYAHSREYMVEDVSPERIAVWQGTPFHPNSILKEGEHIGYQLSPELVAVGEVRDKSSDLRVIFGPVLLGDLTEHSLRSMLLTYDIPATELQRIARRLRKIPKITLDTFLWFLSAINITMNQEIWNLREGMVSGISMEQENEKAAAFLEENDYIRATPQLAYTYELQLMNYLEQGDTENLLKWWNNAYRIAQGKAEQAHYGLSIRRWTQFVSAVALFSRRAIQAGLSPDTAYPLYDYYIDLADKQRNPALLEALTTQMLQDFCERVRKSRSQKTGNTLVDKAVRRIVDHIDHPPRVKELAEELQITPEYLSAIFRKAMGKTISEFIKHKRIERAKRLLRYSDRSLSDIANYLSFSSQSHFQNTFKEITGLTPQEYRDQA